MRSEVFRVDPHFGLLLIRSARDQAVAVPKNTPGVIAGVAMVRQGTDRPAKACTCTAPPVRARRPEDHRRHRRCGPVSLPGCASDITRRVEDGQPGPRCWAEAESPERWTWEAVRQSGFLSNAAGLRMRATEALAPAARATWQKRGAAELTLCASNARRPVRWRCSCAEPGAHPWARGPWRSS